MGRNMIKDLTLMLIYLTSGEKHLVPGLRKRPDCAGIYPKAHLCGKEFDFDILNELTDKGMVIVEGHSKSASFNGKGGAKARVLLKAYEIDTSK